MGFRVAGSYRVLGVSCSNGLSIWYYWALLGFSHKVNELGIFCGDSTILWPNCGMVSFFVKNSSWVIYGI